MCLVGDGWAGWRGAGGGRRLQQSGGGWGGGVSP